MRINLLSSELMHIKLYLIFSGNNGWLGQYVRSSLILLLQSSSLLFLHTQTYGPHHQKFSHCFNLSARLNLNRLPSWYRLVCRFFNSHCPKMAYSSILLDRPCCIMYHYWQSRDMKGPPFFSDISNSHQ